MVLYRGQGFHHLVDDLSTGIIFLLSEHLGPMSKDRFYNLAMRELKKNTGEKYTKRGVQNELGRMVRDTNSYVPVQPPYVEVNNEISLTNAGFKEKSRIEKFMEMKRQRWKRFGRSINQPIVTSH